MLATGWRGRWADDRLTILRANATTSVARELYINALDPDYDLSYTVTQ